ncbi:protein-methionine-sulfoxide reductase catalytic subunit MsrP, partial [Rhodoplanes sp. SY1]
MPAILRRPAWALPDSAATPEAIAFRPDRRALLAGAGGLAAAALLPDIALAQRAGDAPDPSASLYPAKRNE